MLQRLFDLKERLISVTRWCPSLKTWFISKKAKLIFFVSKMDFETTRKCVDYNAKEIIMSLATKVLKQNTILVLISDPSTKLENLLRNKSWRHQIQLHQHDENKSLKKLLKISIQVKSSFSCFFHNSWLGRRSLNNWVVLIPLEKRQQLQCNIAKWLCCLVLNWIALKTSLRSCCIKLASAQEFVLLCIVLRYCIQALN